MAIFETFSKRQKQQAQSAQQDVYQYDSLPIPFRWQVIHIWRAALGEFTAARANSPFHPLPASAKSWEYIHDTLAREFGIEGLGPSYETPYERCRGYFLNAKLNEALDMIDLSFKVIDAHPLSPYDMEDSHITQQADRAVEELNHRFQEHGMGYQFDGGQLIRIDSKYLHEHATKPAITSLSGEHFTGAQEEFLKAHDHYRHGRNDDAIANASKALESTLKTICDKRRWSYPKNATAHTLIGLVFEKELIPAELQCHFNALRSVLESGLPTVRNRAGGHGQGAVHVDIPPHLAAYALQLAATNIVLLVEAHKLKK